MRRRGRYQGKRHTGPWYFQFVDVLRFMGGARTLPGLKRKVSGQGLQFTVRLEVPYYEPRVVRIRFSPPFTRYPVVTVDGPTESRHRNGDGSLCLWYPRDAEGRRWVFEDGLPHLLAIISLHLFKEAWWRETGGTEGGEWLGEEVHVETPKTSEPSDVDDR
jgi:hypothetical protein